MASVALNGSNLADLPPGVPGPGYDRGAVRIGIVHIGVGGFHRAHQARYVDELLRQGLAQDWGICGVGVLPADARMAEVMARQNGLYTLVEKHNDGSTSSRVIGSILDYLHAPADPEAVIERLADPDTKIVSLTVTEGGYNIDAVTGEFDTGNPDIQRDLAHESAPRTSFGLITEALRRRRHRGVPAFTVMSCDNIEGNGHVAQRVYTAFARLDDPELAEWIAANVGFPNCMVDRITPGTTEADIAMVRDELGIEDGWPVVCEPFTQWVLEDSFVLGRPPYEKVGVQMVSDVRPYELMKLRLLNAGHQAIAYFGYLAGYRYAHEVCQRPEFARFTLDYMDLEATPTLEPVPGIDLAAYKNELIERFSNAAVRDTLVRLGTDSSDRIPKFLLPVIRAQLASGGPIERSAAIVASWARYMEGVDEAGEPIILHDRLAEQLRDLANQGGTAFIENRSLFGDLADDPRFVASYQEALDSLHTVGARATIERLAGRG
jgi:mannitol 2-dehydrogenase